MSAGSILVVRVVRVATEAAQRSYFRLFYSVITDEIKKFQNEINHDYFIRVSECSSLFRVFPSSAFSECMAFRHWPSHR